MKASQMVGGNKTGMARAPEHARAQIEATEEFRPSAPGDATAIVEVRSDYAKEAEPVGTMPAPAGLKQLAKTAVGAVAGRRPVALLDKLGERLGFERTGTRLYEALTGKLESSGTFTGGPTREQLVKIRDEEYAHFLLVKAAIERLGGDPTVLTPSANLHATMSKGVVAAMVDPRTDLVDCLEGALLAELVDNDAWLALAEMAERGGEPEMAAEFRRALDEEQQHLERVRTWLATAQGRSAEAATAPRARTTAASRRPVTITVAPPERPKRARTSRTRRKGPAQQRRTRARGRQTAKKASRGRR